ncbi:hypothetical protein [Anaeropeptidivorans aminofermentans]|jgi:hypothetical protein|uniref:hypothetical protein n=1 Tax=Anaeropeptidivorans aminofermentans TaxID=2934315 RepID=UPI002024D1B5|nr:hypothetical protein [Anaeropeptidivorans aminofermentans]MBE6012797.1 hypothetical protein [Lachnospiraceae bacterium]
MSGENGSSLVDYLNQKREMLNEMLFLTKSVRFNGTDTDPENYIALVEKRQEIMDKIHNLDMEADFSPEKIDTLPIGLSKDAGLLWDNIKSLAAQIIELDKELLEKAEGIVNNLKGNMKTMQEGKSIRNIYSEDMTAYNGYYFDKRK